MNLISIKSSFIESIGYESEVLEVIYKGGRKYRYIGVPPDLYKSIVGAESIGRALKENILGGGFTVEKIESETGEVE
jgi:hypothetical protein